MILESRKLGMKSGIEVPALPGMKGELASLIESAAESGAQFVNLNELEISETNAFVLRDRGYSLVNDYSNAVDRSDAVARSIVGMDFGIPVHYCPSRFKDSVQLRERIKRMADVVKWPGELVTDEGTLLKAIIETDEPQSLLSRLSGEYGIPPKYIRAVESAKRVEIAPWIAEEIASSLEGKCYIVEEYPTAERTEVERRAVTPR